MARPMERACPVRRCASASMSPDCSEPAEGKLRQNARVSPLIGSATAQLSEPTPSSASFRASDQPSWRMRARLACSAAGSLGEAGAALAASAAKRSAMAVSSSRASSARPVEVESYEAGKAAGFLLGALVGVVIGFGAGLKLKGRIDRTLQLWRKAGRGKQAPRASGERAAQSRPSAPADEVLARPADGEVRGATERAEASLRQSRRRQSRRRRRRSSEASRVSCFGRWRESRRPRE